LRALRLCGEYPAAQTPYSETADPKPAVTRPNERPATIDELKARAKKSKLDGVLFGYDKFKDESAIMSRPESFGAGGGESFAAAIAGVAPEVAVIEIAWRFPGQTLRETPDKFALVIAGYSEEWQWLRDDNRLYFLFDGDQRLQIDPFADDHAVRRRNVEETLEFAITREQLARLAAARKVEIRVGSSTARTLKPKVLKAWQAVLDITQLDRLSEPGTK
jgi:hypothetical protein